MNLYLKNNYIETYIYDRLKNKYIHSEDAFTLIEVLLVSAVSGIIVFVSSVSLAGFQRRTILRAFADEIVTDLRKVQSLSMAVKNNNSHGIFLGESYYVIFEGVDYNETSLINIRKDLPSSVKLNNVEFLADNIIVFQKLTGYPNISGSFDIVYGGESIKITINSEGVIDSS